MTVEMPVTDGASIPLLEPLRASIPRNPRELVVSEEFDASHHPDKKFAS